MFPLPLHLRACLVAFAAALPCSAVESAPTIKATLATPHEVLVEWSNSDPAAAGHIVEFINRPTDEWVILGFLPPAVSTYRHPRLAPDTPYAYRVRAIYGPASAPVDVTVADGLTDAAYVQAYAKAEDYGWAPPRTIAVAGGDTPQPASIRRAPSAAAPTHLQAENIRTTVSGFRLTWRDRSTDEEGFLLERSDAAGAFTVCAMVPPNINSFGWALEPPQRRGSFRIRAYYFGPASGTASVMTGPEQPEPMPARPPLRRAAGT